MQEVPAIKIAQDNCKKKLHHANRPYRSSTVDEKVNENPGLVSKVLWYHK